LVFGAGEIVRIERFVVGLGLVAASSFSAFSPAQYIGMGEKTLNNVERNFGEPARERVAQWQRLMLDSRANQDFTDAKHMRAANDFFNLVEWVTDLEHWGTEDYWATPIETLATDGGDCEDFSIGKYFSLKDVGVHTDNLRITYVKSLEYNQAHMVLAYYSSPDAEPLILDNINKTILPASQRPDLMPIYSFNGDSLWLAKSRGKKLSAKGSGALPQWQSLSRRIQQETE